MAGVLQHAHTMSAAFWVGYFVPFVLSLYIRSSLLFFSFLFFSFLFFLLFSFLLFSSLFFSLLCFFFLQESEKEGTCSSIKGGARGRF